jgi:hypothetical protein
VRKRETKLQVPHPSSIESSDQGSEPPGYRDKETRFGIRRNAAKRHDNTRKEDAVTMATEERREGR